MKYHWDCHQFSLQPISKSETSKKKIIVLLIYPVMARCNLILWRAVQNTNASSGIFLGRGGGGTRGICPMHKNKRVKSRFLDWLYLVNFWLYVEFQVSILSKSNMLILFSKLFMFVSEYSSYLKALFTTKLCLLNCFMAVKFIKCEKTTHLLYLRKSTSKNLCLLVCFRFYHRQISMVLLK